ncbi:MAG: glycosyltransferase family 2 protein [Bradyrhizobiaceae bacterium]|nr:glycosyltransferase family 2 protein [Bradyrhizobiaceae bacterium]
MSHPKLELYRNPADHRLRVIDSEPPALSVVIPVYNEAASLPALREALTPVLDGLGLDAEIILVDDGSSDESWAAIAAWHAADPRVRALRFARNFGKEAALSAGIFHSLGAAVVLMDSDLQHPPEVIPEFVARWREGYEMVYAVRTTRDGDSAVRRGATRAFYHLFGRIAEVDLPPGAGDFRLLDRKVVDILNRLPERLRFMKGLYAWAGCRHVGVPYTPPPRRFGASAMSMRRLTGFGLDGIFAFSRLPLAISGWAGAAVALFALVFGAYLTIRTIVIGVDVPGYASIMVGIMLLGGVQLLALGVLGAYVGRIYEEIKQRPLYVISDTLAAATRSDAPDRPAREASPSA